MHVHLPKPLHGWRALVGEVGIIVLGVLIALAAEQFVESLHWRSEVRETRKAIDAELSHDLAALQHRLDQRACVGQRLSELDVWTRTIGSGKRLRLKNPIEQPLYFAVRTAVWDSTNGEVSSRMPLDAKLNYASLYSALKTLADLLDEEQTQWGNLESYQENDDLDRRELHDVRSAIMSLKSDNDILEVFQVRAGEFGGNLGLRPEQDIGRGFGRRVADFNKELCTPLL
jgi:hypothetical protein